MDGRLHTELQDQAGAGDQTEQTFIRQCARKTAQHDEGIEGNQRQTGKGTEFLGRDCENEIGMCIGKVKLHRAVTGADAEQAAIGEGMFGLFDLPGTAFDEFPDPQFE